MVKRMYFPLVILFWVIMNVLLWRSEMSSHQSSGSRVPIATVWERILTAPDDSALQIFHRGQKIGFCRWVATIDETAMGRTEAEQEAVEGRVRAFTGYTIDLDGNLLLDESPRRLRFALHAVFGVNQAWQKFRLRLNLKPNAWEIEADADTEQLVLRTGGRGSEWEQAVAFADLARPEKLMAQLGLPPAIAGLAAVTRDLKVPDAAVLARGLVWEARSDWFALGHSRVRAYRIEARLLDTHRASVVVSRVGEILRVELPDDIVLVNEAIAAL